MLTHLSLFSGIGGIDLAAEWAGFTTIGFVEQDPFCQKVLAKHWPGVPIHDDIQTFDATPYKGADLVSMGFPCQDVSEAGAGAGAWAGTRTGLYIDGLRSVCVVRPRMLLLENVTGLIDSGWIGFVLRDLALFGFDAEWSVLTAAQVGAPHQRPRVFIVAYPSGFRCKAAQAKGFFSHQKCEEAQSIWRESELSYGDSGRTRLYPRGGFVPLDDGFPPRVDAVRAYGNAVVPQQAYPILQAIADTLRC